MDRGPRIWKLNPVFRIQGADRGLDPSGPRVVPCPADRGGGSASGSAGGPGGGLGRCGSGVDRQVDFRVVQEAVSGGVDRVWIYVVLVLVKHILKEKTCKFI